MGVNDRSAGGTLTVQQATRRTAPSAHAIAEGALLADLTVMVVLIGLYLPYAGAAMAAISPLPLLLLLLRRGWRVGIQAFFATCLLVTFLTGPFTTFAVLTIALRAFALGIGLRRGWSAGKTILGGAAFLWGVVWVGVTAAALLFPSWRAATEQGLAFTYRQAVGLLGLLLRIFGQRDLWHQLSPQLNDFLSWFLAHWLLVLPIAIWPVLLVAVAAEYIIVELMLPRFGFTPPPLRLPLLGSVSTSKVPVDGGVRRKLEQKLEDSLGHRDGKTLRRSSRRLSPAPVELRSSSAADVPVRNDRVYHQERNGARRPPRQPEGAIEGAQPSPEEATLE